MKKLVIIFLLLSSTACWALPQCPGENPFESYWDGCEETYTYPDGKTYSGIFIKGRPIGNYKICTTSGRGTAPRTIWTVTCITGEWNKFRKGGIYGDVTILFWENKKPTRAHWITEQYNYNDALADSVYRGQVDPGYVKMDNRHSGKLKKHGFGIQILANGDKYVGNWKNNRFDGYGTFTQANGIVLKGIFEKGEFKYAENIAKEKKPEYKPPVNKVPKSAPKEEIITYDDNEVFPVASGTGFAISSSGYLVTNNHVINGCNNVYIHRKGEKIQTTVVSRDTINDLALLKGEFKPNKVFALSRISPEIMQKIYVAGYPFGKSISSSIKVTSGIISSLSGIGDNFSNIQIDASLQPGNSGGPIYNDKGNVVGVAVAKLDLKEVLEDFGVVPENTNFGIKSNVVINFLESNSIKLKSPNPETMPISKISKTVTEATYLLSCWMTVAQIKKFQSQKVMFENLLNE